MKRRYLLATSLLAASAGFVLAVEPTAQPRPVPLTRPEMKQLLEDMKARKPRIPLPELTEEEKEKLGERGGGYEARLRSLYAPDSDRSGGFGAGGGRGARNARDGGGGFNRERDPAMTLDNTFKVQLFWIVCRANNCQYCQGHQESKLANAGMKENEIAALDSAWEEFTPAQQAAFAFTRKVTYEPHRLADADLEALRKHYNDLQILEMTLSVAGNNSINRWKEGVGVPQSQGGGIPKEGQKRSENPTGPFEGGTYLTPTAEKFKSRVTKVAALTLDDAGAPTRQAVCRRPALEGREEVEKKLEASRERTPRLPLADEAETRALLPADFPKGPLPQWMRLLANFPREGKSRLLGLHNADVKGDLKPVLKAQVSWIIARQDRAWYAVGQAKRRLNELGQTDEQIYGLDGSWDKYAPADRALFTVAKKLAASPVVLTDDDVAAAVKLAGPRDVVQTIIYTTHRALFDRVTEVAGLQVEK